MTRLTYPYKIYSNKKFTREGLAVLKNGKKIHVLFTVENRLYAEKVRNMKNNFDLPKYSIDYIEFGISPYLNEISEGTCALCKMTLGSIYYLLSINSLISGEIKEDLTSIKFADLRNRFLTDFNAGGRGKGNGIIIRSLDKKELKDLYDSFSRPSIRRNYISIYSKDRKLFVVLCLFSQFFWKIELPEIDWNIPKLEKESLLPKLKKVKYKNLQNFANDTFKIFKMIHSKFSKFITKFERV